MSEKKNRRGFWLGFFSGILALPPAAIVITLLYYICLAPFLPGKSVNDSAKSDEEKKASQEVHVRGMWDSSNMLEDVTGVIFPEYTIDSVDVRGLYQDNDFDDFSLEISFGAPFSKKTINAINEKLKNEPVETRSETTEEGYPLSSSTRGWERLEDGRIKFSDASTQPSGGYKDTFITIDIKNLKAIIEYAYVSH